VTDGPRVPDERVSTLELFFDLVFVFTITQLTAVLVHTPNARGVLQVVLMLGLIWWMYGGYAWLTNAVAPDTTGRRLFLLAGMGAYLVLALSIPDAFRGSGLTFGIAYVLVVCVHTGLFQRSGSATITQIITGISRYNLVTGLMVLAGGIVGGTAQYVLWALAVMFEWLTPLVRSPSGFEVRAAHFVERHGLVVLIAIGESVVAVGVGAAGLAIDLELVGVALLGLALSACLWWLYFGSDDGAAEETIRTALESKRAWIALTAYGYAHLPLLLGIVAIAATLKRATGHAGAALPLEPALSLACGAALFLLGDAWMRGTLRLGRERTRAAMALLVLVTIPLGTEVSAVAQLGALVALLAGSLVWEASYRSGRSG
jgi:low temperature requirement protein LtrA